MIRRDGQLSTEALSALIRDLESERGPRRTRRNAQHPVQDDLFLYASGALLPIDNEQVQRHVEACTDCLSRINSFKATAQAWEGSGGEERLQNLRNRLRGAGRLQNEIVFTISNNGRGGSILPTATAGDRRAIRESEVRRVLNEAGAIERECDYVLPCGLHSDTHLNLGRICRQESTLAPIVGALDEALQDEIFDTVVSTSWAVATIARRLVLRRTARQQGRQIRHVMVEGYDPPSILEEVAPGARVILILDVVVTGNQVLRVTEELKRQNAASVKPIAIVDANFTGQRVATPSDTLCHVPMNLAPPTQCPRCEVLPVAEFNPIAGRMTKKKVQPRSPSEFLEQDPVARQFWEFVNTAAAFEHHRIIGRRHYVGFIDTARLLRHHVTGPAIVKDLCRKIVQRSGVPDVVLVPARSRGLLFGECLVEGFRRLHKKSVLRLVTVKQQGGHFTLKGAPDLSGQRILVADAAAGHGDTLDELALLTFGRASSTAGAVLLSRLSEGCEQAFDERFSAGFTRLYSMPVRPITVRDKTRLSCSVCRRREDLRKAVAELPAGPVREVAKRLATAPRFRRRRTEKNATIQTPGAECQMPLFASSPLASCRPGIASGIALHALHAAMGDGMASLSLPEIASRNISPAKRAALVADLPAGILKWSGPPLETQLCEFLKKGADRDVWIAVVEMMSRSGSAAWIGSLGDAIANALSRNNWMDERFWARMILIVYRLVRFKPDAGHQMRQPLEALAQVYDRTPAQRGLQAMLKTTHHVTAGAPSASRLPTGSGNHTQYH